MFRLKNILTLLLAVSVVMAGFPVQARSQCPMAAQMQMQHMDMTDMKDCKGCAKTAKQEQQKKNGCCGDPACAAKCLSLSNVSTIFFSPQQVPSLSLARITARFYVSDNMLASHVLHTQERPPKYLS